MRRIKNYMYVITIVLCVATYFYHAEVIMDAVKEALVLCYNVVIPSLFVFMVICNVVLCMPCSDLIAVPFMPLFRLVHIKDRQTALCCILGILGGFATGAMMMDRMKNQLECDDNTIKILSPLITGNSPSFVILAVGVYYLGNIRTGIILYCCLLISASITSFILSFLYKPTQLNATKYNLVYTNIVTESIRSSVSAIVNICGVIIIAFSLCEVFSLYTNNSFILLIISILSEVTTACDYAYNNFGSNVYLLSLTLAVIPLSTYLQIKFLYNNNIFNIKHMLLCKIIQLSINFLLLGIAVNLFPAVLNVYASGDISVNTYWNTPHISFCFLLVCISFLIAVDRKIGVFTIGKK